MIETKEIDVETSEGPGVAHVPQMDGFKAGRFFFWLAKKVGPALTGLIKANQEDSGAGLQSAFAGLEESDFDKLVSALLGQTRIAVNGEFRDCSKEFGPLFAGHTVDGFKLLWAAFQHNFGNFQTALGDLMRTVGTAKKNPTPGA